MGYFINVFIFPNLSLLALSEAAMLARRWDSIVEGVAPTSFEDTSLLLAKQLVDRVTSWEASEKQLEAWGVFCHVFMGDAAVHPAKYEICTLV